MKTVNVCKAQGIGDQPVESVTLVLERETPDFPTLAQYPEFYQNQAEQVMEVLWHLPGGTFDRVLCEMLKRKASLFVVPLFDRPEGGDA